MKSVYPSEYRAEIDGLRAFAVLSVVFFHAFPSLVSGGFVGVDVFFVISGFLITCHIFASLDRGDFSFSDFFGRRVRRIFPALLLVLLSSIIFGWFVLFGVEYAHLGEHIVGSSAFVLNFVVADESGYFATASETKPLLHLWSLAVEEQFYILWPFVLWLGWRRGWNLLLVTFLVVLASFYLNLAFVDSKPRETFFWPVGRFWELLSGSILAWLLLYRREDLSRIKFWFDKYLLRRFLSKERVAGNGTMATVLSFLGLLLLFYSVIAIDESFPFPSAWTLLPVFGCLLVIGGGSHSRLSQLLLMNRVAVWFGLISYPLYLWHWPIFSFLHIIGGDFPSVEVRVIVVIISILLAWLTYRFIERPLRFGGHKGRKAVSLVLGLFLVGCFGVVLIINQGFSARLSSPFDSSSFSSEEICDDLLSHEICYLGAEDSDREVLVYGDSHAHQYAGALERRMGETHRITVVTGGSCFAGTDLRKAGGAKNIDEPCSAKIDFLETEAVNKEYDLVITSQRWHGYEVHSVGDYEVVLEDRVKNFGISSKRFVIMGATPDVDISCERNNLRPLSPKRECVPSSLSGEYVENFAIASFGFRGLAEFVYPHRVLCGDKRCKALLDGEVLYRDEHHLSLRGALLVIDEVLNGL